MQAPANNGSEREQSHGPQSLYGPPICQLCGIRCREGEATASAPWELIRETRRARAERDARAVMKELEKQDGDMRAMASESPCAAGANAAPADRHLSHYLSLRRAVSSKGPVCLGCISAHKGNTSPYLSDLHPVLMRMHLAVSAVLDGGAYDWEENIPYDQLYDPGILSVLEYVWER
jgi:hypothetical protein